MSGESKIDFDTIPNILRELHDDVITLLACSLVSRAFRSPSQKLIFFSVVLKDSESPSLAAGERCHKLWKTLEKKPQFITDIRELCLSDGTRSKKNPHWVPKNTSLPRILSILGNLRSFSLISEKSKLSWGEFSEELQCSIRQLLRCPSLTTLRLWDIVGLPRTILAQSPQLKTLSLASKQEDPHVQPGHSSSIRSLDSLELIQKKSRSFDRQGLLSQLDLSKLRFLAVVASTKECLREAARIMTTAVSHIESFSWTCLPSRSLPTREDEFRSFPFDFAKLTRLRFFSFSFPTDKQRRATEAIAWMIKTLSKLDITQNIEAIIINVDLTSIDNRDILLVQETTEAICGRKEWDALDSILADCYKRQKLQRVTFAITYRYRGPTYGTAKEILAKDTSKRWVKTLLARSFPLLWKRKVLQVLLLESAPTEWGWRMIEADVPSAGKTYDGDLPRLPSHRPKSSRMIENINNAKYLRRCLEGRAW
ncbi:hypothetical protein BDZ94DRAFT_1300988 [Collybia nuda]|uniref:F-box domain-containing protein n=1 Tax=Collybia nuda TaxID=64659 RepID=A0A9P6CE34_9AGAR|nr:hypothetical protein BDZ94DRAFT_1300988 [Collybia nuda]